MPLPLLVPLLLAGARIAVPRLVQAGLTLKKAKSVANIIDKAAKKSLLKGKIPTNKTLLNSFNQADKNLLSQSKFTGLLSPSKQNIAQQTSSKFIFPKPPVNPVNPVFRGRGPISSQAERIAQGEAVASSISSQEARRQAVINAQRASQGSQTVNQNISRQALNNQRIEAQQRNLLNQNLYGPKGQLTGNQLPANLQPGFIPTTARNPISAFVRNNPKKTAVGLTGAGYLGSGLFGGEQPVQATDMTTGASISQTPQQAPAMRFGEVLRPSSQSTAKEVLNAALLRAGLSLMKPTRPGQTPFTQALESAATVADSQNTFRSGKEALEAGQNALGETAKIVVRQNSDGTYNYTGTTDGGIDASTYFGDENPNAIDQSTLKAFMTQNPTLTREQVIAGLEQKGYTITGE